MRHTPATATLPSTLLEHSLLHSVTPAQSAPPSIAQYSAGLAHDARNMLAAMDIYCELLSAPGVLQPEHQHFLSELRLLRDSSGQLLDRLLIEALRSVSSSSSQQSHSRLEAPLPSVASARKSPPHALPGRQKGPLAIPALPEPGLTVVRQQATSR